MVINVVIIIPHFRRDAQWNQLLCSESASLPSFHGWDCVFSSESFLIMASVHLFLSLSPSCRVLLNHLAIQAEWDPGAKCHCFYSGAGRVSLVSLISCFTASFWISWYSDGSLPFHLIDCPSLPRTHVANQMVCYQLMVLWSCEVMSNILYTQRALFALIACNSKGSPTGCVSWWIILLCIFSGSLGPLWTTQWLNFRALYVIQNFTSLSVYWLINTIREPVLLWNESPAYHGSHFAIEAIIPTQASTHYEISCIKQAHMQSKLHQLLPGIMG